MPLITPELAQFLDGPNSIVVGTQDGKLMPECARALLLRCGSDGDSATVWLPAAVAARTIANLAVDKRIAIAAELPSQHKTRQLKGVATKVGDAPANRRATLEQAFELFIVQCGTVGLPRRLLERVVLWPAVEISVRVSAVFEQTPGPGAGEPLPATSVA
jgi:hypothetical protein